MCVCARARACVRACTCACTCACACAAYMCMDVGMGMGMPRREGGVEGGRGDRERERKGEEGHKTRFLATHGMASRYDKTEVYRPCSKGQERGAQSRTLPQPALQDSGLQPSPSLGQT